MVLANDIWPMDDVPVEDWLASEEGSVLRSLMETRGHTASEEQNEAIL